MLRLNLPTIERLLRTLSGLIVAAYGWLAPLQPNAILVAIGFCVALTGLAGFCPACALVGRRLKSKA